MKEKFSNFFTSLNSWLKELSLRSARIIVVLLFKDILAAGDQIGYSKDNCYLTIFDTGVAEDNWYLGTQALKDLVLIFY